MLLQCLAYLSSIVDNVSSVVVTEPLCLACPGGWRNGLRFDPLESYGGYSYVDFMLYPLADALNAVLTANTQVDFGMQVRTWLCPACFGGLRFTLHCHHVHPVVWGRAAHLRTASAEAISHLHAKTLPRMSDC